MKSVFTSSKVLLSYLLFLTLALTACDPRNEHQAIAPQPQQTTLATNNADFSWSLTQSVDITVQGFQTAVPVRKVLVIRDLAGNTLYQGMHALSDIPKISLQLPTTVSQVEVEFGAFKAQLNIVNRQARFVLCADC